MIYISLPRAASSPILGSAAVVPSKTCRILAMFVLVRFVLICNTYVRYDTLETELNEELTQIGNSSFPPRDSQYHLALRGGTENK
jgi:hypothetical protein